MLTTPRKVFFENCTACKNASFDVGGLSLSQVLDKACEMWGQGRLVRNRSEWIWIHDPEAKWVGCCADKVYGIGKAR